MPVNTSHPTADQLRAFHCGKLGGPDADTVESHLSECEACLALLRFAPDDSMLELARLATSADPAVRCRSADEPTHPPADTGADADAARTVTCAHDESPAAAAPAVPPELEDHPRYKVLALLGHGGMGAVYLAEHLRMERKVALKVIRPGLLASSAALPRFRQEVKAAARLDHANIVRAYDADEAGGLHFLVMEFVDGTDLAKLLRARGPLPAAEAADYARQAALGLQHAHEGGMVHRDIKPHNLMVARRGEVKILDFGLAGFARDADYPPAVECGTGNPADTAETQLTSPGSVMGTADYIAPEQTRDAHGVDTRADIYSLGCTLYQLLAGRVPFERGSMADKMVRHAVDAPVPLSALRPDLPASLVRVVETMMAKNPDDRYPTPGEVAEALRPFARPAARDREEAAPIRPRRRFPWAVAAAVLLCGLVAASGVVVYRIQTDNGEVVITAESDDVEVLISKGGKQVTIIDTKTNKKITLPTGEYDVAVKDKPDEFTVSTDKLVIRRGKEALVTVERKPIPKPVPIPPAVGTVPDKERALALLAEAVAAGEKDDHPRAEHAARAALALNPDLTAARVALVRALGSQGRWRDAADAADEAIRRDPRDSVAHVDRAWVRLNLRQYREAIADCDKAAELGANYPMRLANRGWAYAMLGEFEKGRADYDEYVRRLPGDAKMRWIRGLIHERLGNYAEAKADFLEAIRRDAKIQEKTAGLNKLPPAPPGADKPRVLGRYGAPDTHHPLDPVLSPDGRFVTHTENRNSAGSHAVWVYDTLVPEKVTHEFRLRELFFTAVTFLPDGRMLTVNRQSASAGAFRFWNPYTGETRVATELGSPPTWVGEMAVSADGKWLAYGLDRRSEVAMSIPVRELATGKESFVVRPLKPGSLWAELHFAPDGKRLVTWDRWKVGDEWNWVMRVHEVPTGKEVGRVEGKGELQTPPRVPDDGKTLVVVRHDKEGVAAEYLDATTGKPTRTREFGPDGGVVLARVTPDGRLGVTGSADGKVRVYDLADGREVFATEVLKPIHRFAFTPDGRTMSVHAERTLTVVRLPGPGVPPPK